MSTGYYSKKIKSAETFLLSLNPAQDDDQPFRKLQFKDGNAANEGTCISQYIDARLPCVVIERLHLEYNQEVFRRGEYAITKYKTRHCLYCSLYYQPLYISAHTKLCRENEKPDDQRYSRAYWYNAAKARFDRLSEAEKKYGVDDTAVLAGVRVYETPAGQLKTTCPPNCNKLTGDNIEKYEQHARLHRREYPYFCIHCKNEYFFGYEQMRTHLSKCGSYKKFLQAIKESNEKL